MQRKIIHVDMDAFFASVEQRDSPEYRGRPLIVGGKPDSRGVVAACSYEARRFGIHSAMPCARAWRLCPEAIFVSPRFEVYRQVSNQIRSIFRQFTDRVEPLSLDEAYLDVSECQHYEGSATRIAESIRSRILEVTGLTASAGVSYNKFLAKTASDVNKPNGLTVILPAQGEDFVARLPIGRFYGIGKVTEQRMQALGIQTGADLRACSLAFLQQHFGKSAGYYYQIARGQDRRDVCCERERKSIGAEQTFQSDVLNEQRLLELLQPLAVRVVRTLRNQALVAQTLTLKVKYHDFSQVTRSQSYRMPFDDEGFICTQLPGLLAKTAANTRPVRLVGLSVSALAPADSAAQTQLTLL